MASVGPTRHSSAASSVPWGMTVDLQKLIKAKEQELLLTDPRYGGGARMHAVNEDLKVLRAALAGDVGASAKAKQIADASEERDRRGAILRDTLRPPTPDELPKLGS
ncbi:hypothetical protein D3C86_1897600 [compost metagenome]